MAWINAFYKLPTNGYDRSVIQALESLQESCTTICYVSLSKPIRDVKSLLSDNPDISAQFIFIDASGMPVDGQQASDTIRVNDRLDSDDFFRSIQAVQSAVHPDGMFFDSLCDLSDAPDKEKVKRFIFSLITLMREHHVRALFACRKENNNELLNQMAIAVDLVNELMETDGP
ncbi:MAG: hypothetical protein ABIC95_07010 [archaeon]